MQCGFWDFALACVFVLIHGTGVCVLGAGGPRLSTAADYDLPRALAEVWFCQLQIVSAIV